MGLIKSIINAASGTLGDQWVDFITCDSLSSDVLMAEGKRPSQARSGNTKFSENIITNGSKINVAPGQCMLISENGKIVDFCAEPGQYTYDTATQPSLLGGGFKDLGATFQEIGKRFLAGGAPTTEQKVYYINTKEIIGNKIGFGKIPFRDSEFQFTMSVQGFGHYTFHITNPLLFYNEIAGNVVGEYRKNLLLETMKSEVMSSLQPALGKIAAQRIAYDQLIMYPEEIGKAVNEVVSARWGELRGIGIKSFAIESINVDEATAAKIAQFQEARVLSNQAMAAGRMVAGTANAMEDAANNTAGAMTGFMGMGFAQNAGGGTVNSLFGGASQGGVPQPIGYQQPAAPAPEAPAAPAPVAAAPAPAADSWTCECGTANTSKFCQNCGGKKPEAKAGWDCDCGAGSNLGKFCPSCGGKKPAAEAQYQCDKCGFEPADKKIPPKFCPECGDPFDNNDIIG